MKILFKVIVLVIVLVSCIYLWKMFNGLHITKAQFAISYGLVILAGGLFVGWLTDFDFNNQSLYDNREADPLSDWVKIQDRAKGKGDFWKGLLSDSDMDERLQWELENQYDSKGLKHEPPYIPGRPKPANIFPSMPVVVFDEVHRNNPKTIKQIISQHTVPGIRKPYERYAGEFEEQYRSRLKSNMPAWFFDEAGDSVNPLDHEQSK